MNVATLERPHLGQAPLNGLPPDVTLASESLASPDFTQLLHEQAETVRQGNVTVDTFGAFWEVASQITYYDDGIAETYHGPDGRELTGADREAAVILCRMRSADAWLLSKESPSTPGTQKLSVDDVHFICDIFRRYIGICELDITADELDQLELTRIQLCATLDIADPKAYSLEQLIEKASKRLELHQAIATGQLLQSSAVPKPVAPERPHYEQPESVWVPKHAADSITQTLTAVTVSLSAEPDVNHTSSVLDKPLEIDTGDPFALEGGIMWGNDSRWPVDSFAPPKRHSEGIRSHRRPPERRPGRVRRWALRLAVAAASAMLAAVLHPWAGGPEKPAANPVPSDPVSTPEITIPPVLELEPQLPPPADYYMSLGGEYNPEVRTGAIWFNVEDYAAQLGYQNLTLTQLYKLTDQCIQYMNTKLPGGMSWDKAMYLNPDTQLPYPPANVMDDWINTIINDTVSVS